MDNGNVQTDYMNLRLCKAETLGYNIALLGGSRKLNQLWLFDGSHSDL